jgi:hypothetical protein
MDFNKHKSDWQRVGARRRTDGLQQAEELESFKEELLRAIAPLELRINPKAGVPSSRPALSQRTGNDALAAASKQHSSKSKLFVFGTMTALIGAVLIGVTFAAADMEQVALADLSVPRWLAQLTGNSQDVTKNDGARATLSGTIAQARPSVSLQAATTEASVVHDHLPPSQTTSPTAESVQPADLAQPAAATSDRGQDSSSRKDGIATPTTNEGTLAATSGNVSAWPVDVTQEKTNSELYRQYLAWQASREKPQIEQRRSVPSFKRLAEAHASRTPRASAANVTGNKSGSSTRANESSTRSNPKDKTDLAEQSATR